MFVLNAMYEIKKHMRIINVNMHGKGSFVRNFCAKYFYNVNLAIYSNMLLQNCHP